MSATLPASGRQRRALLTIAASAAVVVGLAGCGDDGTKARASEQPPSAVTSVSPSPTPDEQALLLAQYRKFWSSLTPVSRLPASARQAVLADLAVDPALKSVLHGMNEADAKHQVLYGANVPRPVVRINPDATTALVDDCQDSSRAGVMDKATGKRVTVGVPRNHVSVTMKKSTGALWKVSYVDYSKLPC
jgi:hypothetical protein